jgi:hypothetical protein
MATRTICIVSRPNPSFTLLLLSVYHLCIVTLTIPACTVHITSISPNNPSTLVTRTICIVSRHPPPATLCLSFMHSHFNYTYMYILCHGFCRSRFLSLFWQCSADDVTGLLAIADPFFIFHLFCLVFPHTWFSFPHYVLCI